MVFVGPSGCGKTTALRMVAGLEEITEGEVHIGGRVVNDMPPKDRDIAMVFQNYALYPHMTVAQNLAFGLKLRKVARSEVARRVQHAAETLGLEEYLDRKPQALSGGQRQRVAMGRAIVREPQAFLMDEPLSNLDAKLRVQMRAEIQKLQRSLGVTTIYVTHDQTEAMTMGDRIAVMRDGALQQVDTPERVYQHPVNQFVAGFIGSPAMNIVDGLLEHTGDGGRAVVFGSHHWQSVSELRVRRTTVRRSSSASVRRTSRIRQCCLAAPRSSQSARYARCSARKCSCTSRCPRPGRRGWLECTHRRRCRKANSSFSRSTRRICTSSIRRRARLFERAT